MFSLLGLLLTGYKTLEGVASTSHQDPSRYPEERPLAQPPPAAATPGAQFQVQAPPGQPPLPGQPGAAPPGEPGAAPPGQPQDGQMAVDPETQRTLTCISRADSAACEADGQCRWQTSPAPGACWVGEPVSMVQQVIYVASEVIGMVIWFLIWQRSCMYQKRTLQTASREQFKGDLAPVGLCDCLSLPAKSICEAVCCEVCLVTENLEKSKPPSLRSPEIGFGAVAFLFCSGAFTCGLYPLYLIVSQRLELSKRPEGAYSSNNCLTECLKVWFCGCCSNMQVATFLDLYDETFEKDERTPLEAPVPQSV